MTEVATIARLYAKAIFEITQVSNFLAWSNLISEMVEIIENPDVNILIKNLIILTNPQIALIFTSILKTPLNIEAKNLINILIKNHRLQILPEIARQFYILKNLQENIINVKIISAFKLSSTQLQKLDIKLSKKFNLKLNLIVEIDNTLIGGIRIIIDDQVFDTSIRTKLQQLYIALTV